MCIYFMYWKKNMEDITVHNWKRYKFLDRKDEMYEFSCLIERAYIALPSRQGEFCICCGR